MNNNFDFGMNQYLGPQADFSYNPGFNFDVSSYPNLYNEQLPPNPSNLFPDYPPVYPPAPVHPNMSVSSGQGHMYPPSLSEYPSNGTYSWSNSPSPATLPITNAPQIPQGPQVADDDQRVQQEFLSLLDEYHPPIDNFYNPVYHPEGSQDTISIPSPYPNESGDYSPPNSLMKPAPDDSCFPDFKPVSDESVQGEDGTVEENEDLSEINIRDLNKALRDQGYSQEEQMEVKQIRRKQKNRVYAKNCRKNKEEKKTTMKTQKELLEIEIVDLKSDVEQLRAQRNQYKLSYDMMQQRKQQQNN